jgi:CO dehydrogenase/acetyl-CoA synthase delta subunit
MHEEVLAGPTSAVSCLGAERPVHQSLFELPAPEPSAQDSGVTLDVFTGELSFEQPLRAPLLDTHDDPDTRSFRSAVRAHDPLVHPSLVSSF